MYDIIIIVALSGTILTILLCSWLKKVDDALEELFLENLYLCFMLRTYVFSAEIHNN